MPTSEAPKFSHHAYQKFAIAIGCLATGTGDIRERLQRAMSAIAGVGPQEVSAEVAERLRSLWSRLGKFEGREIGAAEALKLHDDEACRAIAEQFLGIYEELSRQLAGVERGRS